MDLEEKWLFGCGYRSLGCRYCNTMISLAAIHILTCFKCRDKGWYVINIGNNVFRAVGIFL